MSERPASQDVGADFGALTASQLLALAFGAIAVWLSARLLGPSGYGTLALMISIFQLLYVIGIQWAMPPIVRFGREALVQGHAAGRQVGSWLPLPVASFLASSVVAVAGWPWLSRYAGSARSTALTALLAVLAATTFSRVVDHLLQMSGRMRAYAAGAALGKLTFVVALAAAALAAVRMSPEAVLLTMAASLVAQAVIGLLLLPADVAPVALDWTVTRRMAAYSSPLVLGYGAGYMSNWVDVIVLRALRTPAEIGVYHLAYQAMLAATSPLIGIVTLAMPILTGWRMAGSDDRARRFLVRQVPQASVIWALAMPALGLLGRLALPPLFGSGFEESSRFLGLLLVGASFQIVSYCYSPAYASYDLLGRASALQLVIAFLNLLGDLLTVPRWGAMGAAAATSVSYAAGACLTVALGNRRLNVSARGSLLPPSLASASLLAQAIPLAMPLHLCAIAVGWVVTLAWARRHGLLDPSDLQRICGFRLSRRLRQRLARAWAALS